MPPIDIKGGERPATDPSGPGTQLVVNWTVDAVGANHMRPGLVSMGVTGLSAEQVIGLYPWGRWLIVVTADRWIWAIHDSAPTVATALSDGTAATMLEGDARPTFAADGVRIVIAGGGQIQQWQGVGLSSRLIAGSGPNATHVVYIGERFVANDSGTPQAFAWSDQYDGNHGTWQALSYWIADADPDPVTAIYTANRELWVVGTRTVQVYGLVASPANAYDVFEVSNVLRYGAGAPYSFVPIGGMFGWLDERGQIVISNGHAMVTMMEPQVISADISEQIRDFADVRDCWAYRRDQGHDTHLIWVFPAAGRSFVLDLTDKTWMEEAFYGGGGNGAMPIYSFARAFGENLVGGVGQIYKYDSAAQTDVGGTLLAERVTGYQDFGTPNRKRSKEIRVVVRRGAHGTGQLELRVNDDGEGWGDWEQIPVADGDLTQVARVFLGGVFRRRAYHFRYSGTDEMALLEAHDDVVDLEAQQQQGPR